MTQQLDFVPDFLAEIQEIRRDIHAHPELGYEEKRTSQLIADKLTEWGIPVIRGLGGTGVVGIIKNGDSTRAIGLRADIDALPLEELNTFVHVSRHPGKMHACGHDGHIAMLLGAAAYLAQHRPFQGTIYLIFQPAEESYGGAVRMIEDGLFEQCPMDAIFGIHNWPDIPFGQFGVRNGPMMASSNTFSLTIHGRGGHAAQPQNSLDPVMLAIQIAQSWQTIITRNLPPVEPAVLSITKIHAGTASNVIPDDACMAGTVRTFSLETLDTIEKRMRDIAEHTAMAFGASIKFTFERGYPPLINHSDETALAIKVIEAVAGKENVLADMKPVMVSEDFSFFLEKKPGCYAFIGSAKPDADSNNKTGSSGLHSPYYDFNDALLPIGIRYWVKLAQKYLHN